MQEFLETIRQRVMERPNKPAIGVSGLDADPAFITFRGLWDLALSFTHSLPARRNPRIVVVWAEPTISHVAACVIGSLLAGHNPVVMSRRQVANLTPSRIARDGALHVRPYGPAPYEYRVNAGDLPALEFGGSGPALLQLTSGTEGLPRVIKIKDRELSNQAQHYGDTIGATEQDVCISWSPLYHDQGLIANLIIPLYWGMTVIKIQPRVWLKRPSLFMQLVSRFKGSISRWPNFGFAYAATRVASEDLASVSLASLRVMANSGEIVTESAINSFGNRFEQTGFDSRAILPSYGMAENCVCVAICPYGSPLRTVPVPKGSGIVGRPMSVSVGLPLSGTSIWITDRSGEPLLDNRIGRIAIRGDSLCVEEHLQGNGWFRTSDEGFVSEGWLHVVGRADDAINIQGEKLHPEALEVALHEVPGVRPGRVVALGIRDGELQTERLVVLAELKKGAPSEEVIESIRRKSFSVCGLIADRVIAMPEGWIEKSSSGKISRKANAQKLMRSNLFQ